MWFAQAERIFERYCYVVASLTHESMRRFSDLVEQRQDQTPTKSSRLVFCLLARPQVPLIDVGNHQLIMTASMKVIRAVAPFGGPGGLYTTVASSSTEYGPLFAEYQDVAQHKEEVIRVVAPFGGPTTAWAATSLEDEASSIQPAAS